MALNNESVAIYWDFENLHANLVDGLNGPGAYQASRFRPQDELIDVIAIIDFALSIGPIAINRAFANWVSFNRYKQALLQAAIELIQVFPPGANAKNGADIKLCLDVMEDMVRFPHIGTIIVIGGDSDYMPLSYKVKAAGRKLVGIGGRRTTNQHWARSCHEFKYYENLVMPAAPAVSDSAASASPTDQLQVTGASGEGALQTAAPIHVETATSAPATTSTDQLPESPLQEQPVEAAIPTDDLEGRRREARDMVIKALTRLAQAKGEPWVNKAGLRPYVQRMDPTFHESNCEYATFNALLASMSDRIETRKGESDHELRLRP